MDIPSKVRRKKQIVRTFTADDMEEGCKEMTDKGWFVSEMHKIQHYTQINHGFFDHKVTVAPYDVMVITFEKQLNPVELQEEEKNYRDLLWKAEQHKSKLDSDDFLRGEGI